MKKGLKLKSVILLAYIVIVFCTFTYVSQLNAKNIKESKFTKLSGPYLGQKPPGDVPKLFAPGLISTRFREHTSPVFSPDGKEVFYHVAFPIGPRPILFMRQINNRWTYPRVALFSGKYNNDDPYLSPDGTKLVFRSSSPLTGEGEPKKNSAIWIVEKTKTGWSEARGIGYPANSGQNDFMPSITRDGTLYFVRMVTGKGSAGCDIYRSRNINRKYQTPEILNDNINSDSWDAHPVFPPDETYMIFASNRPGGFGKPDLYISFKEKNGSWGKAKNMGSKINSKAQDGSPHISPDGKYLFFCSDRTDFKTYSNKSLSYEEVIKRNSTSGNGRGDVYWVDAKVIEELRPK